MIVIPHYDQYFGLWAITEDAARSHQGWFAGVDLHVHLQSHEARQAEAQAASGTDLQVEQGVAIIALHGSMMKHASSMGRNTSTVQVRRQIRAAAANADIGAILLHIESPGGTVAGTAELADDIANAKGRKPVYAFIEDLGASAAYWAASQATKIFANAGALVGSIGTYGVVHDMKRMADQKGITVHVLRAGDMKGAGTPGTEITAEQLADWQSLVTKQNEFFIRGVATGRGLSLAKAREWNDGRVHLAGEAASLGMIDGVQTLDATLSALVALSQRKRSQSMRQDIVADVVAEGTSSIAATVNQPASAPAQVATIAAPLKPQAATYHELKAGCIGADEKFICSQLEANATLSQAQTAWMAEQNRRIAAANDQAANARAAASKPGIAPLPAGGTTAASNASAAAAGDPIEAFNDAVLAEMDRSKCPRHVAHATVCRREPELREAMVAAHNAKYASVARRR